MTGFHVGQLVVCVDDSAGPYWGKPPYLMRGTVYTVAELDFGVGETFDGQIVDYGLWLSEVPRLEFGYSPTRFRPISDDRLAIFRQHLAPVPSKQVERA